MLFLCLSITKSPKPRDTIPLMSDTAVHASKMKGVGGGKKRVSGGYCFIELLIGEKKYCVWNNVLDPDPQGSRIFSLCSCPRQRWGILFLLNRARILYRYNSRQVWNLKLVRYFFFDTVLMISINNIMFRKGKFLKVESENFSKLKLKFLKAGSETSWKPDQKISEAGSEYFWSRIWISLNPDLKISESRIWKFLKGGSHHPEPFEKLDPESKN